MLEQISSLQSEILRAPPEVVVPTGIMLFLILVRLVLALPDSAPAVTDHGLEAAARRWFGDRIDEHVNLLAEAYREAGMRAEQDDLPPRFALTIESFIADVLRELDSKDCDVASARWSGIRGAPSSGDLRGRDHPDPEVPRRGLTPVGSFR